MKTWITGCRHLLHYNIIRYCNRPFKDAIDMTEKIVKFHNERVKDDDVVYDLGDIAFFSSKNGNGENIDPYHYINQFNGTQIFIEGNHDRDGRNGIKTKNQQIILNQKGLSIQLLHDPTYASVDYDLVLCSHVHDLWHLKELRYMGKIRLMINCGVDVNNFRPVELLEVLNIYHKWKHQRSQLKRWEKPKIINELNKGTKAYEK